MHYGEAGDVREEWVSLHALAVSFLFQLLGLT